MSDDRLTAEPDVRDALGTLARYTNRPFTDEAVQVFCMAFARKLPHRLFGEAMAQWLQTHGPSSYLPSVKDIETILAELRRNKWERDKANTPTFNRAVATALSAGVVPSDYERAVIALIPEIERTPDFRERASRYRAFAAQWGRDVSQWHRIADRWEERARPGRYTPRAPEPQVIP
jgi:hypothetical protein